MQHLTVVDHPLVQYKLSIMRQKEVSTAGFRRLLREISLLLAYEVTRELELTTMHIETPMCEMCTRHAMRSSFDGSFGVTSVTELDCVSDTQSTCDGTFTSMLASST